MMQLRIPLLDDNTLIKLSETSLIIFSKMSFDKTSFET